MDDHLPKPFDSKGLAGKLDHWLPDGEASPPHPPVDGPAEGALHAVGATSGMPPSSPPDSAPTVASAAEVTGSMLPPAAPSAHVIGLAPPAMVSVSLHKPSSSFPPCLLPPDAIVQQHPLLAQSTHAPPALQPRVHFATCSQGGNPEPERAVTTGACTFETTGGDPGLGSTGAISPRPVSVGSATPAPTPCEEPRQTQQDTVTPNPNTLRPLSPPVAPPGRGRRPVPFWRRWALAACCGDPSTADASATLSLPASHAQ
jgi:hypothetical protein